MTQAPRILIHKGELYFRYSKQYRTHADAFMHGIALLDGGEISESDKPIVQHCAIYLLAA